MVQFWPSFTFNEVRHAIWPEENVAIFFFHVVVQCKKTCFIMQGIKRNWAFLLSSFLPRKWCRHKHVKKKVSQNRNESRVYTVVPPNWRLIGSRKKLAN